MGGQVFIPIRGWDRFVAALCRAGENGRRALSVVVRLVIPQVSVVIQTGRADLRNNSQARDLHAQQGCTEDAYVQLRQLVDL